MFVPRGAPYHDLPLLCALEFTPDVHSRSAQIRPIVKWLVSVSKSEFFAALLKGSQNKSIGHNG